MKKFLIIIAIILVVSTASFGAYFAWKKSRNILTSPLTPAANISGNNMTAQNMLPQEKVKILSRQPVVKYWVAQTATSSDIFYVNEQGQILKISKDSDDIVSDRRILDIKNIIPSQDGKNIAFEYGQKSIQFEIFNLDKKIWTPISNISAIAFSPDGKKIAYFENAKGTSNLMTKSIVDSKQKAAKIISINQRDFSLVWPSQNKILLAPKPSYDYKGEIWQINLTDKTLAFLAEGYGLLINWFNNSNTGLKFETDVQKNYKLDLIDDLGKSKAVLNFITMPYKCAANYPAIYCAIPTSFNTIKDPTLPDDYLKKAAYSIDAIYKIDANDNSAESVLSSNPSFNFDAIYPSLMDNQIIFINRYDNKIYSVKL